MIEAAFGLGEVVVGGQVEPDTYTLAKQGPRVLDTHVGHKAFALVRGHDGKEHRIENDEAQAMRRVLTDDELLLLAALGLCVEQHYGAPQDIEWAEEAGQWYLGRAPAGSRPADRRERVCDLCHALLDPRIGLNGFRREIIDRDQAERCAVGVDDRNASNLMRRHQLFDLEQTLVGLNGDQMTAHRAVDEYLVERPALRVGSANIARRVVARERHGVCTGDPALRSARMRSASGRLPSTRGVPRGPVHRGRVGMWRPRRRALTSARQLPVEVQRRPVRGPLSNGGGSGNSAAAYAPAI